MNKFKITLNKKNVKALLKSNEVQSFLEQQASVIKARAGNGYGSDAYVGKNRVNVAVYPITKQAHDDCYKNNSLIKALK